MYTLNLCYMQLYTNKKINIFLFEMTSNLFAIFKSQKVLNLMSFSNQQKEYLHYYFQRLPTRA